MGEARKKQDVHELKLGEGYTQLYFPSYLFENLHNLHFPKIP